MELNLRTVLVVMGCLVMLAILVDGFRRMRSARQEALKIDVKGEFKFPEENFSAELPNGGARIIGESNSFDYDAFSDFEENPSEHFTESTSDSVTAFENDSEKVEEADSFSALTALDDEDLGVDRHSKEDTSLFDTADGIGEVDELQSDELQNDDTQNDDTQNNQSTIEAATAIKAASAENTNSSAPTIEKEIKQKLKPLNLDEQVPLLMDVEELGEELNEELNEDVESSPDAPSHRESEAELSDTHTSPPQQPVHNDSAIDDSVYKAAGSNQDQEESEEYLGNSITEHIELTKEDIKGIDASVSVIASMLAPEYIDATAQSSNSLDTNSSDAVNSDAISHENEKYTEQKPFDDGRQEAKDLTTQAAYAPVKKPGINAEILANRGTPDLVLITHVTPHDEHGFLGEDVLFLVNSCDLRHGEKGIFHRYEKENGEGKIQFSMANSINPGTFDPSTLLYERINGLSLFMSLPGPEKAMDAFEAMTEMASVIARNLGGDVHDETHSIMALQTIEHNRQLVRDFVRKQKLLGKKK